ncbi:hypothetical protein ACH5RR_000349 [Cinchona calisaya]|uniref:pectinesterase n=1 Tax=Cinchona calisaya TaxID=153742 RepID=A0ABD3B0V4_9GENT
MYKHSRIQQFIAKLAMELSFVIVLLLSLISPAITSYSLPEIKPWCDQTIYPDLCEYFFTHSPKFGKHPIQNKSDFLKVSVQLVLDRAINATENAKRLGPKCRNRSEKAAWLDCVDFFHKTVIVLNQTITDPKKSTPFNIHTSLGTTLTNLDTCEQGFIDFGITNNVMPLIVDIKLKNLTINALGLNNGPEACGVGTSYNENGFPNWLSPIERKLLQSSIVPSRANIVVAQDGSGDYQTVKDAIDVASKRPGNERLVIYVKAGEYNEYIEILSNNIMLVGDGIGKTIITGNRYKYDNITTWTSATVAVQGENFIALGITFRNTAGPAKGQAVAFRSSSKFSVHYKCSFEGYQDTLYVHDNIQFYRGCDIYGTVDFIMGDATVVFQNCTIFPRYPPNNTNTITAQSRLDLHKCSGMSFHNCQVKGASDLEKNHSMVRTYLGRPWKDCARVVFLKSDLGIIIDPEGWLEWGKKEQLYFGEYGNKGVGASTGQRVNWPGFHVIENYSEASKFSVKQFIGGDSWLPATNTPFDLDI